MAKTKSHGRRGAVTFLPGNKNALRIAVLKNPDAKALELARSLNSHGTGEKPHGRSGRRKNR